MKQGDSFHNRVIYSEDRVIAFSNISGDRNPIHLNEEYAKQTVFGSRIVHGMLVASQISACLAKIEGAIYMSQTLNFLKPVYIGDEVKCNVTVTKIEGSKAHLKTFCSNDKYVVIEGTAIIKII